MAGFDASLDKELWGEEANFETTKIRVGVMSYNEGTPKIQISRQNLREEDGSWTFSKLGRMRKDEAEKVNELLQKALQNI